MKKIDKISKMIAEQNMIIELVVDYSSDFRNGQQFFDFMFENKYFKQAYQDAVIEHKFDSLLEGLK